MRRRVTVLGTVAVSVTALLLAACGSGDDSKKSSGPITLTYTVAPTWVWTLI